MKSDNMLWSVLGGPGELPAVCARCKSVCGRPAASKSDDPAARPGEGRGPAGHWATATRERAAGGDEVPRPSRQAAAELATRAPVFGRSPYMCDVSRCLVVPSERGRPALLA